MDGTNVGEGGKTATEYFLRAPGYAPASETAGRARLAYANLEIPLAVAPAALRLDATGALQPIIDYAQGARFAQYRWRGGQGVMPIGYTKGMALVYARAYCKLIAFDPAAVAMSVADRKDSKTDALSWYAVEFADLGLSNGQTASILYATHSTF